MLLLSSLLLVGAVLATCDVHEFQEPEVIAIGCNPVTNQVVPVTLEPRNEMTITHFPPGTKDIDITLSSTEGDLDVCLFDRVHGSCVHGNYNCVAGYACRIIGGVGGGPVNYAGAQLSFSGDQTAPPLVSETITITGTITSDLYLKVMSYGKFGGGTGDYNGQVRYSHGGIATNCNPETTTTCIPCENHACPNPGEHPVCNGSTTVTCTTCAAGEKWNVATQRCEAVAPMCFGFDPRGQPQTWSTAQKGVVHVLGGVAQPPSDGCCNVNGPDGAVQADKHFCKSTGDPHILQFDGNTNHAYINGDYIMYQGQDLQVVLRHVNIGNVAGNNAFFIGGSLLDGHTLEYYDKDTQSSQPDRATPEIYIDGQQVTAGAGGDIYSTACQFFTGANIVCSCKWRDGIFTMVINDKTVFKFDRWHEQAGWNNAFLQVDPLTKRDDDIGMCTYKAPTNSEPDAGKANVDPYPLARTDCTGAHSSDPFKLQSGIASNNAFYQNYFCMAAADMRRRKADEEPRRRLSQIIQDCQRDHREMFIAAYSICAPCVQLGNVRTETCLMDPCLMVAMAATPIEAAEFAMGEAQGCSEEIVMRTPPEDRVKGAMCPAGTDWDQDYQVCMGDFEVTRASECSGTRYGTVPTFIKDCHNRCKGQSACAAYTFDAFTNTCHLYTTCTSFVDREVQFTTYVKDTSGHILARGDSLDDSTSAGPSASYGTNTNSQSTTSSSLPGPLHDLYGVDDDVEDLKDSVRALHDELEDDVRDVHQAVSELRAILNQMSHTGSMSQSSSSNTGYYGQTNSQSTVGGTLNQPTYYNNQQPNYQQPNYQQPNNYGANPYNPYKSTNDNHNDDWKTVGIVSAVMSFVLLCGAVAVVSVYFCCLKK